MEYQSKNYETDGNFTEQIESYLKLNDDDYEVLTSTELYITRTFNSKRVSIDNKSRNEILSDLTAKLEGFKKHKFFTLDREKTFNQNHF